MNKPSESIRAKLMKGMLLTSGAVLLLGFVAYFVYEIIKYRELTTLQLQVLSKVIAANSTAALAFESPEDGVEILSALEAEPYIETACLYDENGIVFATYPESLASGTLLTVPETLSFQSSDSRIQGFVEVNQGERRLGTLFISRSMGDFYSRMTQYSLITLLVAAACFLLSYFISRKVQQGITAPIIHLAETSMSISRHHDYSVRVRKSSDDETGLLTEAFNTMLEQIEIQDAELRSARQAAQRHADELELKVQERTAQYRREKEFAQVVVNSSLVLIAVFDTELRLLEYNRKCEEEFGIPREKVIGKPFSEVFHKATNSQTYRSLLRSLEGETIHNPCYQSHVTGYFYESFVLPLRREDGSVYAVLMTAHNISQIIESSERLRKTNIELQRKNSDLEQFAYVASHDLQEPLRKIQTFMQLVRINFGKLQTADQYMLKIESAASRMSMLIKDVLEYSRLSKVTDSFAEVDLNVIVENVRSDFELLITQRAAVITVETLPTITGNRLQCHQLFANLINNAIKFCHKEPRIQIRSREANASEIAEIEHLNPDEKYIRISFEDNGIGFEQEFADKVFTIFQRLNTRDKFEGTGIGLALCKKIVDNHSGHITVQSEPGRGSTFTVFLPLGRPAPADEQGFQESGRISLQS